MSALAGVRVLDLTRFLAGPFCTSILADLGAEVVKVETPRHGDEGRAGYAAPQGVPIAFLALNRNKKGITLDIRTEEGKALFRRLLPHFDVLVENFAGGTMADMGLAPAALVAEHPRLIVASLSGFGQTGPWARRPSYDIVAQASGGLMALTGFPDTPPTRAGGSLGDYVAGLYGAIGVLAAVAARARTGRGQTVDVSSQDAIFALADNWPTVYAATGELPPRVGNRHLATAPYDCHRARDGWVVVAIANNKLFRRLMEAIGRPELGTDPRFRGGAARRERSVEINGIVGAWVAEHTIAEVLDALSPERANVPCAPVYGIDELIRHPQLLARDMIVRLPHETVGEVVATGVPVKLSDTPGGVRHLGPTLGQHNEEIYRGLLGLLPDELERLAGAGVI